MFSLCQALSVVARYRGTHAPVTFTITNRSPFSVFQLMASVRSLAKDQGPKPALHNIVMGLPIIEQFEVADKWLRPMRL